MSVFATNPKITPFLWFKSEAEEAARFYVSVFPNSRILDITNADHVPPMQPGVLTVDFELDGTRFIALNGNSSFLLLRQLPLQFGATTRRKSITTGTSWWKVARRWPAAG